MNFATLGFCIFLPTVLLGYYLLPGRAHKYRFLLAASWFFYMSWNPRFIWVILFTSVVDYASGLLIAGARSPGQVEANVGATGWDAPAGWVEELAGATVPSQGFRRSLRQVRRMR